MSWENIKLDTIVFDPSAEQIPEPEWNEELERFSDLAKQEYLRERLREIEAELPPLWRNAVPMALLAKKDYEWVVDGLIAKGEVTMLTGDFGTFKSYLSYFFAESVSSGGQFLERSCQRHPVLILDRENSHATVSKRRDLIANLASTFDVRIIGRFSGGAPDFVQPDLLEVCRKVKPVIIVDSLQDFHPGKKENDTDDMVEVFQTINKLLDAGAIAVLILHHVAKSPGNNYRGAASIPGSVGACYVVKKDKNNPCRISIEGFKARDSGLEEITVQFTITETSAYYKVVTEDIGGSFNQGNHMTDILTAVRNNPGKSKTAIKRISGVHSNAYWPLVNDLITKGELVEDSAVLWLAK